MTDLPDYIFGIGPGRSGTKSLAALLSDCESVEAQHEGTHIEYPAMREEIRKAVMGLPCRAAVGYQWLQPAKYMLEEHDSVRVVGLVRPRKEYVQSATENLDATLIKSSGGREAKRFPTFSGTPQSAWFRYWRWYMAEMCNLLGTHGRRVTLLPTDSLNDPPRVLDACGIPSPLQHDQAYHLQ